MLREIRASDLKKSKINKENCILVMKRKPWWLWIKKGKEPWSKWYQILAPSDKLLDEFLMNIKKHKKVTPEIHNEIYKRINYEQRFRKEILNNSKALEILEELSKESATKDIYLICRENSSQACHRRILLRICEEQYQAKIKIEGIEP